ncbi:MAG: PAS domain S-box protein, partial [Bacteroidota bacterium]
SNFTLQLKARVFFNICIAAIFALLILIASSSYVQLSGSYHRINLQILIPTTLLLLIFIACLLLLIKGKYSFATHLFLIATNLCVWYIMFFSRTEHVVVKLDTIVLVLAIINSIPLFIHKYKSTIIIYLIVNLSLLLLFVYLFKNDYGLSNFIIIDYVVDTSIALFFSGVAAYQIVRINNKALEKVEKDYQLRLKIEQELFESELKYKTIFEDAQVGIYQTTPDGKILQANPALLKMLGYNSIDELSKRNLNVDDAFNLKKRSDFIQAISKSGLLKEYESEWLKKNGDFITVRENARIVPGENGDVEYFEGFVVDVTEHKQARKELKESEEKYRTLMENLNEVIMMVDNDDKIQYVNKKFTEKLGYTLEEIKGKVGHEFLIEPKDHQIIKNANQQRIEKTKSQYELAFNAKNGTKIDFLVSGAPVINPDGNTIGSIGAMVDISDRKKTEIALKDREEQLAMALLGAKLGMWDWDMKENLIKINDLFVEMLGYNIADFKDSVLNFDDWRRLVHKEDFDKAIKLFNDHVENRSELYEAVFRMKHKNGHWKWILARGRVLEWDNNKPIRALGTHLDITSNKKAQIELKESEEKFREMAELLPIAVWETDLQGICTYTNKVGLDIHGFSYADLISGINVLNLIIPEEKEKASKKLKKRIRGALTKGEEYTAVKKDGTKFPARIYTSVVYKNGKPVGFRGVTVDITEAKAAEKELKESEERYRTIIEAFPDIIMISDLKGNIIFGNSALERITGINKADYSNPDRKAHIHPDDMDSVNKATKKLLAGNNTHTGIIENRFIDSWGNTHWFSGIMSKLILNNETYLQTISRDITDKKNIEQELEKYREHLEFLVQERTDELATANEELKSTNEELLNQREELETVLLNLQNTQKQLIHAEKMASLGVLASGIAHEINNPLNFIKGGVFGLETYLKGNLEEHLDELNPLLDGINEGVTRAASIVTSLNHYNRKDDSKMTICDIHSIIDNCLTILQNQLKDQIKVNKKYTRKKHTLNANEGKLHQAILNILSNAIQSIKNRGTITIKTGIKGNELKLQISDTGCGIKAEDLHKIMDPFYTTKEPGKGTGLGLSITHNILQEHNASIEFDSKINKGTTVLINIPLNKN